MRTGVTAIHPRGKGNPGDPVAAGFHSQNGNGEMTGVSWIKESGTCQGPIAITNTHAVGIAHAGIIAWMNRYHPEFADVNPMRDSSNHAPVGPNQPPVGPNQPPPGAGSVIAVVATDAPLFPSQCKALARRVTSGLARTGASGSHFSGDLFLAFSTANPGGFTPSEPGPMTPPAQATRYDRLTFIPWGYLDPFFEAVVQATEEAVINSLIASEEMVGRQGHRSPALPRDRLAEIIAARNA